MIEKEKIYKFFNYMKLLFRKLILNNSIFSIYFDYKYKLYTLSSAHPINTTDSSSRTVSKLKNELYSFSIISYIKSFYISTTPVTTLTTSTVMNESEIKPILSEKDKYFAKREMKYGLLDLNFYYDNPVDKFLPEKFTEYQDLQARKNSVHALEEAITIQRLNLIHKNENTDFKLYYGVGKRMYERYSLLDHLCLKLEYINNEISLKIYELKGITDEDKSYKWISPDLSSSDLEEKLSKYYNDNNPNYKAMKDLGLDMQYIDKLPEIYNSLLCPISQSLMKEPIITAEVSINDSKIEENYDFDAYETGKLKFEPDVYEASSIRKWYIEGNNNSPITRKTLRACEIYNYPNQKIMSMTKSLISEINKLCNSDPEIIVKIDRSIELKEELLDLKKIRHKIIREIKGCADQLQSYKFYSSFYPNKESIPKDLSKENFADEILEKAFESAKDCNLSTKHMNILSSLKKEKLSISELI